MSKNSRARAEDRAARAQAAREAQKAAERRRTIRSVTLVVVAMALVVGAAFLFVQATDDPADVTATPAGSSEYGVTMGEPDAPVDVIVYEDFLCPFCGDLEAASREPLQELVCRDTSALPLRGSVMVSSRRPTARAAGRCGNSFTTSPTAT